MKAELAAILEGYGLDAVVVAGMSSHNPSMNYFTGSNMFTKAYVVIPRGGEPILFYRTMERDTAAKTGMKRMGIEMLPGGEILGADGSPVRNGEAATLRRVLIAAGVERGTVAFSGRFEFGAFFAAVEAFRKAFPEYTVDAELGDKALADARYQKDESELAAIRSMGEVVTGIVGKINTFIRECRVKDGKLVTRSGEPVRIGEIKRMINLMLTEAGAENPEGTIFSIGRDAGVPHNAGNDEAQVEAGKTIVFDFFPCRESGYFFDFTRTWYIGTPPQWLQEAYDRVRQVHHEIVAFAKAGKIASELQDKTCDLFEEMGYETIRKDAKCTNGYVHSVGHGLGLNVHEPPFMRGKDPKSSELRPGTVFTIEPGLYFPDGDVPFGIRLEDTFYIDENGDARYFAPYPYQLGIDVPPYETA